ncbi:MAG: transcription termination factor Rho [Candidatus Marinimicrobia bacterium]|nr:transcription termination factor Rho [Candidatus Neomarinimicrobiota bacterium]
MENIKSGVLEIMDSKAYLRDPFNNFEIFPDDVEVPHHFIKEFKIREGCFLVVELADGFLKNILAINNLPPDQYKFTKQHKELTPINPLEQLMIGQSRNDTTGRLIDRLIPIAKGQRGLIISPAKAGKTSLIKHIAKSVSTNYPDIKLATLLVDERPEEITDFKRALPKAMVFHSSADMSPESHMRIARMTINMASRMLEAGEDVFILIDSLTRLARASNKESKSSRTMSGGLGIKAMEIPRQLFGRAKNVEDGGSLTILASILVETGSRMDEMIFQEFKGTGNWDLRLSRELAERRIFPAIDISQSSTRKEHLIFSERMLEKSNDLRRKVVELQPPEALLAAINYLNGSNK